MPTQISRLKSIVGGLFILFGVTIIKSNESVKYEKLVVGVACINDSMPPFLDEVYNLGTVSLHHDPLPVLTLKLPFKTLTIQLPENGNQRKDVVFDIVGHRGDKEEVWIRYIRKHNFYFGTFMSFKSNIRFVYRVNDTMLGEMAKLLTEKF